MGVSSFGQRLRNLRLRRGLSLREVSAAAGLSFSQISRLERQKHAVRADDVERLARALGATSEELTEAESALARPPLPLIPGATQDQAATYPTMRVTRLARGRRMNLSRIARMSPSWTALILSGVVRLSGPALNMDVFAGAKLSRKVLIWHTITAEALEPAELLWVEESAAPTDPIDTGPPNAWPGAVRHGRRIGYYSTRDERTSQAFESALRAAGCTALFYDLVEERTLIRPQLVGAVESLDVGATLVVPGVHSLGLRTHEVLELISGLHLLGARFLTLDGDVDTSRPGTTDTIAALAKLELNPRSSRIRAGMLAAADGRVGGKPMGRPPALNGVQIEQLRALVHAGLSSGEIRQRLGFTKSTVERYVRRIREGVL